MLKLAPRVRNFVSHAWKGVPQAADSGAWPGLLGAQGKRLFSQHQAIAHAKGRACRLTLQVPTRTPRSPRCQSGAERDRVHPHQRS